MTGRSVTEEQPLINRLAEWGLTRAEAEVYVYLLQRPTESGGSKIAVGTGLHRQYVYIALEKLLAAGLVEAIPFGKHKKYRARSPLEIEKITRKRSVAASDLVHELNKISAIHSEQDFEVLQGANQIQQYEMDYVYGCTEGEEELIIGGHSKGFFDLMGDGLEEYIEEKERKGIKVQYIGSLSEKPLYELNISSYGNQNYRYLEGMHEGVTHLVIRKDSVSFWSFLTPPLVYVIKSATVADDYRKFFQLLWDIAGKQG